MDITRLITQARGTLPWSIPLMVRIGLLKSYWANRTIRYTTPPTLANRKADYRIVWTFFENATYFPIFSPAPDSGVCK